MTVFKVISLNNNIFLNFSYTVIWNKRAEKETDYPFS